MKFIKKNKFTILVIGIFIVLVVLAAILKNMFFINTGQPVYGNRLDGIDDVEISSSQYNDLEKKLKDNKIVTAVESNLDGRIINIIVTVKDDASKKDAKKLSSAVVDSFSKEQLAFYDIQIFVKKADKKQDDFPIIGYKHNSKSDFYWTKDRKVTTSEDK